MQAGSRRGMGPWNPTLRKVCEAWATREYHGFLKRPASSKNLRRVGNSGSEIDFSSKLLRLQLLQIGQHFLAVTLRTHLQINLPDHTRRINQERVARGKGHSVVFRDRAVVLHDRMIRIGQQFEVQSFFRAETFVRIDIVDADAENHRVLLRILIDVPLKVVGFNRAAGSEILGIEIKDNPLPFKLIERNLRTFLTGQRESRGLRAGCRRLSLIGGTGGE
jgi:hypothetical protein